MGANVLLYNKIWWQDNSGRTCGNEGDNGLRFLKGRLVVAKCGDRGWVGQVYVR